MFLHEDLWLESDIDFFQGETHVLLQSFEAMQNDGTERKAEKTVKGNRDAL